MRGLKHNEWRRQQNKKSQDVFVLFPYIHVKPPCRHQQANCRPCRNLFDDR
jgi:hypothetical protein